MGTMPPPPPSTLPPQLAPDSVDPLLIGEWHLVAIEGEGADVVDDNLVEGTASFTWDRGGLLGFVGHGRVNGCAQRGGWFEVAGEVLSIVEAPGVLAVPGCPVYVPAIDSLGYALDEGVRYEVLDATLVLAVPDGLTFTFTRAPAS
jgi:hypothetical protein